LQDLAKLLISEEMKAEQSICWNLSRNAKTQHACSHKTRLLGLHLEQAR